MVTRQLTNAEIAALGEKLRAFTEGLSADEQAYLRNHVVTRPADTEDVEGYAETVHLYSIWFPSGDIEPMAEKVAKLGL